MAQDAGRVLLVDDDDVLRKALARALRSHGCEVTEAVSGRKASEFLGLYTFELVLSDVRMPDMDGIELLRVVHERDADLPVLLITGAPDLETAMKAVEYGAFAYLQKPIELAKLEANVTRAVAAYRAACERRDVFEAVERERKSGEMTPLMPSVAPTSFTGALLGGRYRVGALIGEGGMGSVYEAVREDLAQMKVALKILHPTLSARRDVVTRFRREAEVVAALDHPNIVRILDFQAPANEPAFLVMERLHGIGLGTAIVTEAPLPLERVAFIAHQVLAALAATHEAKVVHRDLKPDNVFLISISGVTDVVKLLDFGIAKLVEGETYDKLTKTGVVMGTPAYMAPECARGDRVDARGDLYAVGCLMYEALSGRVPFRADNYHAMLFTIQEQPPVPLATHCPDLPPEIVAIVTQAMAKNPADRYQTAAAMAEALSPWVVPQSSRTFEHSDGAVASAPTVIAPAREDDDR
jgi:CheY-like chemotaxis protein